jgi:hypothetical protein
MNDIPATPDAFATLDALIKLAVDPAACRTRLAKLQKLLERTAAAEQRLAERSVAFDQKVATEKAALDERKAALNAKALELMGREALAERTLAREKADRLDRARPLAGGMSITVEQP